MNRSKLLGLSLALFCSFIFYGPYVRAASDGGSWYNPFSAYTPDHQGDFSAYFSLGGKVHYGTGASNDSTTTVSRPMIVYGAEGIIGIRWKMFIFGGGVDYSLWNQLQDPSQIGNSNIQGAELSAGPLLGFEFGPLNLIGRYNLYSTYSLSQQSASAQTLTFLNPISFSIELRLRNSSFTYWGLLYENTQYQDYTLAGGPSIALSSGSKMTFNAYGLVFGVIF